MNVAAALIGLAAGQTAGHSVADDYGLEVVDYSNHCDWARRYVSVSGPRTIAIRLMGAEKHYIVSGFWKEGAAPPESIKGTFSPARGQAAGRITLYSRGLGWTGNWNRHTGSFELTGARDHKIVSLWQELPRMKFGFLQGHEPLGKTIDVPDNLGGGYTETQTPYAFQGTFSKVVQAADHELLATHWKRLTGKDWYSPYFAYVFYTEPGPTGRVVVIEKDSSVPDSTPASDLVVAGTHKRGWVGVTLNCPKTHG